MRASPAAIRSCAAKTKFACLAKFAWKSSRAICCASKRPAEEVGVLNALENANASLLAGVRVLDLSTIVAGPAASMILADFGADVVKVEPPGGEAARAMGPHRGAWGAYFAPLNRGKRSIVLDLRHPAGREAVLRLASKCDVFLENFRGGKAA